MNREEQEQEQEQDQEQEFEEHAVIFKENAALWRINQKEEMEARARFTKVVEKMEEVLALLIKQLK